MSVYIDVIIILTSIIVLLLILLSVYYYRKLNQPITRNIPTEEVIGFPIENHVVEATPYIVHNTN
jgi:hypothetical protein